jgi:hypothetical protein
MAKAYWVVSYRSISDDAAREKHTKLAVPAVLAARGRFLARGIAAKAYEHGVKEGPLWSSLRASPKQSLHTIVRSTKRHSPFWGTEPSATCESWKGSTSERMQ